MYADPNLLPGATVGSISTSLKKLWTTSQEAFVNYVQSFPALAQSFPAYPRSLPTYAKSIPVYAQIIPTYAQSIPAYIPLKRRQRELMIALWAGLFVFTFFVTYAHVLPGPMSDENDYIDFTSHRKYPAGSLIPPKIWQIYLTPLAPDNATVTDINPEELGQSTTWLAKNPDYQYTVIGSKGGENFVKKHFSHNKEILDTYRALRNPGLKSDLLRYLVLSVLGGVYSDTDTYCLQPIDKWVPKEFKDRARVIVGLEFDRLDGEQLGDILHELQFAQWTIAAAPGHPLFDRMVTRALDSLKKLTYVHDTTLATLTATSTEVMNSTGPAAWTDAVFEELQLADPTLMNVRNLSGIMEPRLYGDILVLPIDGFGMGQRHSNSTHDGTIPTSALIRHMFHGSWRGS
jgi:alpha 1,6-mannosyltransferase